MGLDKGVLNAFAFDGPGLEIQSYGDGLINQTFRVQAPDAQAGAFIVQRLNPQVFRQPEHVMQNLRVLLDHAAARRPALRIPAIRRTRDGRDYYLDAEGAAWRALAFIEHSYTRNALENLSQATEVGRALGRFHMLTRDLAPAQLHDALPGFHATPRYFAALQTARTEATLDHRTAGLAEALAFAAARTAEAAVLEQAKARGELPVRVIHGDPKLNNFLFDRATHTVTSLIDLDTVGPGLVHYDIGDCLRSCCNPAGEAPADLEQVRFDLSAAQKLLDAYCGATQGLLSAREWHYGYDAIRLIPLELGVRFLTDHLAGDRYFKVRQRGQNLWRARVQFALCASIERQAGALRAFLQSLAARDAAP